ncbi:MAG: family 43 glycosylhydrolase, partial [Oscillospiraceae bacterium]|nr:family 43 glycosylhydrolase [Oscillospiraceae bacterium]
MSREEIVGLYGFIPADPPEPLTPDVPARTDASGTLHHQSIYYSFDDDLGGAIGITNMPRALDDNLSNVELVESDRGGGAAKFTGSNGLYLGQGLINTGSYSIAMWIKPDAEIPQSRSAGLFFGRWDNDNFIALIPRSDLPEDSPDGWGLWSGTHWSDNYSGSTQRLVPGEWQHLTITVTNTNNNSNTNTNSTVRLYLNGIEIERPAGQFQANQIRNMFRNRETAEFFLGTASGGGFEGQIDDLYIYNRAISANEVLQLVAGEIGTDPAETPVLPAKDANGAYYWSFDGDFGGAASVATTQELTGVQKTIMGTTEIVPAGRIGGAAHFSGNNGLYLGQNAITSDTYSVSFWARPQARNQGTSMFFGGLTGTDNISIMANRAGNNNSGARVGGTNYNASSTPTLNGWSHFAFVADGGTADLYINGFRVAGGASNPDLFTSMVGGDFYLGLNLDQRAFVGQIDELYIYDGKALTVAEVKELSGSLDASGLYTPGLNTAYADPAAPVFGNVSVHDPSIIRISESASQRPGEYFVIGSHLAAAHSTNMLSWTTFPGSTNESNMFHPVTGTVGNGGEGMTIRTMAQQRTAVDMQGFNYWASDIIEMPNGKFYQYYSLTRTFGSTTSGVGVAIANQIEGPYIAIDLFVKSGNQGSPTRAPDGAVFNANIHPNAIDPTPFFDKDGKFWLTYGSWSGGFFIYEMDEDTGLPLTGSALNAENNGYGRLLYNSTHNPIEGPYIMYVPEADYYYMFGSYGGLDANDGYNVRMFRSKNPDGPYEDARYSNLTERVAENNASDLFVGGHRYIDTGVKVLGGYKFGRVGDEEAAGTGYLSPGHNSAYYDSDTGRAFIVPHTRFEGGGNGHQVRVHEMFVTANGWLAVAPLRYDGSNPARAFTPREVVGTYKILNHGRDSNAGVANMKTVTPYNFQPDGTVTNASNAVVGSWVLSGDHTAAITLTGVAGMNGTYSGVFLRQWDQDNSVWAQTFTAISNDGLALWGVGVAKASPAAVFEITFNAAGGSVSPASAVTGMDGKLAALPTPSKGGETFLGWFTLAEGGTEVTADTYFTQDGTIYAQWEAVSLGGTASITGTSAIGQTLTVQTGSITGGSGAFAFQWKADGEEVGTDSTTYDLTGADAGKIITCVVTRADAEGFVTATLAGGAVPYNIVLHVTGHTGADAVSFAALPSSTTETTGRAADEITIYYNLDSGGTLNSELSFNHSIALVDTAGSGTRTYTVAGGHALAGVITISAAFVHTDLTPQHIEYAEDVVHKIYGDAPFTNPLTDEADGTGEVTYESDDTDVATVDEDGEVTIVGAGTATITATKAACAEYEEAQATYELEVLAKELTVDVEAVYNPAEEAGEGTVSLNLGTPALLGVAGTDDVSLETPLPTGSVDGAADENAPVILSAP